jgi:multidrug efflux pump subunit AcrA (membrane-fusion protein)
MHQLFHKKRFHVGLAAVLIISMGFLLVRVFSHKEEQLVTATAESGSVRQHVSVSGAAKAKEKADLSFPASGVVERVLVEVGDTVEAGDILAVLKSDSAESERLAAMAGLRSAIADRGELIAGPSNTARTVTSETIQLKKEALATTIDIELSKVKNAKRTLLSDGLTAYTNKTNEDAAPPTISGTYACDKEGSYTVSVYPSSAASGYSYRLFGLEDGVFTASTDQPAPLGTCGLRVLFDADSKYTSSTWTIEIPNTKSSTYTLNKNAYELAVIQSGSAIDLAKQELALAEAEARNVNATPRSEALVRADANVEKAQATLSQVESALSDRIMRAPFSGTVTSLSIKPGETVRTEPVMTILTDRAFEITARVPEIDVAKLAVGQPVELLFDANDKEVQRGTLSFVSLQATEIDGVAYFDTYITLDQTPYWMRSGLNADIDIIVSETSEGLRIPKRFLVETDGVYTVLRSNGETIATTTVEVLLRGSDGFVSLKGLNTGDIVVAP